MNDNDIRNAIRQEGCVPVARSGAGNGNDAPLRAASAVRTAQDYVTLPGYRALPHRRHRRRRANITTRGISGPMS
jgi:hypothetical protein